MYYLGIDGGGTRTTALVSRDGVENVIKVSGESINFRSVGLETAKMNMRSVLKRIEAETGISHFRSVFIGMSALSDEATENELKAFCDGVFDADRIGMNSDIHIALAACGCENALVAICGTGSMAAAKSGGKVMTRGGYGYILGDEGSAYAIALSALRLAVKAAEGTVEETSLTKAALDFFGAGSVSGLLDVFYDPPMPRARLASFAAKVTECAAAGDLTALGILRTEAESFAETVRSLCRALERPPEIYLYGGVFEHDGIFTRYFTEAVREDCVSCRLLETPPVEGAVRLSLSL